LTSVMAGGGSRRVGALAAPAEVAGLVMSAMTCSKAARVKSGVGRAVRGRAGSANQRRTARIVRLGLTPSWSMSAAVAAVQVRALIA
jgi:hypothetical protein